MTEAAGIPIGLATDGANRNDCKLTALTIASIPIKRPAPTTQCPQGVCLDKAYDHDFVGELLAELDFTAHIRSRGRRPASCARTSASAPGGGSSSASTHGSTATERC